MKLALMPGAEIVYLVKTLELELWASAFKTKAASPMLMESMSSRSRCVQQKRRKEKVETSVRTDWMNRIEIDLVKVPGKLYIQERGTCR